MLYTVYQVVFEAHVYVDIYTMAYLESLGPASSARVPVLSRFVAVAFATAVSVAVAVTDSPP